jgi:DNA-binding response OmpR family regulator
VDSRSSVRILSVRVLVVEDVRRLADDVAEGLRDRGMAVDVSYDGLDAIAKLNVTAYEVVVLDRDLPGMHGDAVCRYICDGDHSSMVMMLTAADEPADRIAGLGLGADDYLSKPFHFAELVLRVQALGRRHPTAKSRVVKFGGIELDPLRRTVQREGQPVDLSVKEFALLEALMHAASAPLSAEDLLTQVWDEHADPFTKTVSVTMGRLRRKLGHPSVIETLPGVGYRIRNDAD